MRHQQFGDVTGPRDLFDPAQIVGFHGGVLHLVFFTSGLDIGGIVGTDELPDDLLGDIPAYIFAVVGLVLFFLLLGLFQHSKSCHVVIGLLNVKNELPAINLFCTDEKLAQKRIIGLGSANIEKQFALLFVHAL